MADKFFIPEGMPISQSYKARPWLYQQWGLPGHEGVDILAPVGTVVTSPFVAKVERVGNPATTPEYSNYGNWVRITNQATGESFILAHLSNVYVKSGEQISKGRPIATTGNTGFSEQPHLHVGYEVQGKTQDPMLWQNMRQYAMGTAEPTPTITNVLGNKLIKTASKFMKEAYAIQPASPTPPMAMPRPTQAPMTYGTQMGLGTPGTSYAYRSFGAPSQYVVKPGETLWGIAQKYLGAGSKWPQLGYQGRPETMPIGTVLNIPGATSQQTKVPTPSMAMTTATVNYTVKPGDTLSSIAQRYLGSASRYPEISGYSSGNPNLIFPGEKLYIPGK